MNVQNLKLQFSNPDRPSNVTRTQIPVARFGLGNRTSSSSDLGIGNRSPSQSSNFSVGNRSPSQSSNFSIGNRSPSQSSNFSIGNCSPSQSSNFSIGNRSPSQSSNFSIGNRSPSQSSNFSIGNRSPSQTSNLGTGNRSTSQSSENLMNGNLHQYTSPNTTTSPASARFTSHTAQPATSPLHDKWKTKYDDVEKRRKLLLTQNQKLSREHEDLQRKYSLAQREMETLRRDLADKDSNLNQLRKLSEAVYKEYDQLKNQYELETGTMQKAMQRATQWYRENRELKRRSSFLMQKVMQVAPETINFADDTDSGISTDNDDFEDLRKTVHELNQDVAKLQAEVNEAKLQEFEAQETIVDLSSQLEEERNARCLMESELKELRSLKGNLDQVSRLVTAEVTSLREQCVREKETAQRMKQDADKAKKERNILAHQSQLLMSEVAEDQRLLQVLLEVESLKRSLEEEQQRHAAEIQSLQEKMEEKEEEGQVELLEEKLKLVESELQQALERADRAESISYQLSSKVKSLEKELDSVNNAPPPPPPPLPPPPPPMPLSPAMATTPVTLRRRPTCDGAETNSNHTSNGNATGSAVLEMANLLGIPRKNVKPADGPGAIDDIINEIKGGRFTLKSTEPKQRLPKVEEKPPVVQEMINVLGTLRKRRTPSMRRQQFERTQPDVQL